MGTKLGSDYTPDYPPDFWSDFWGTKLHGSDYPPDYTPDFWIDFWGTKIGERLPPDYPLTSGMTSRGQFRRRLPTDYPLDVLSDFREPNWEVIIWIDFRGTKLGSDYSLTTPSDLWSDFRGGNLRSDCPLGTS